MKPGLSLNGKNDTKNTKPVQNRGQLSRRDLLKLGATAPVFAHTPSVLASALRIEITGVGDRQIPIAIPPFTGNPSEVSTSMTNIVRQDLLKSGMFRLVDTPDHQAALTPKSKPNYPHWKAEGVDALLNARVSTLASGQYEVRFRVFDIARQVSLGGLVYTVEPRSIRLASHKMADFVYEALTGEKGFFGTRLVYVSTYDGAFALEVSDLDGHNAQTALNSQNPIMSPTWSPDGQQVAYVSFESRKPVVYIHTLATGRRHIVANHKGSNSAPVWAPNGQSLVVVLTRDGLSQLYQISPTGTILRRLNKSYGIDTEPAFSPDGRWIYFTSDRGGTPQIYRLSLSGGRPQRITFEGEYNTRAAVSPDGKYLAWVAGRSGQYRIAVRDLSTNQDRLVTDGPLDESPSFAPNSRRVLYASRASRKGVLKMVSVDGLVHQAIAIEAGNIREPAWGPFV